MAENDGQTEPGEQPEASAGDQTQSVNPQGDVPPVPMPQVPMPQVPVPEVPIPQVPNPQAQTPQAQAPQGMDPAAFQSGVQGQPMIDPATGMPAQMPMQPGMQMPMQSGMQMPPQPGMQMPMQPGMQDPAAFQSGVQGQPMIDPTTGMPMQPGMQMPGQIPGQMGVPPQAGPSAGDKAQKMAQDAVAAIKAPKSPETKKMLTIGGIVLGVLAVLAIGVSVINGGATASKTAQEYVNALASGDADKATEMADPGVQNNQRALLTSDVYKNAKSRIEVISVEETPDYGGNYDRGGFVHKTVNVAYAIDGERFDAYLSLSEGPKKLGVLKTWKIDPGSTLARPLRISMAGASQVKVGESEPVQIPMESETSAATQYVYPGVYSVAPVYPENTLVADPADEKVVATMQPDEDTFSVGFKPGASEALATQLVADAKAYLTRCTTIPTNMDDDCPSMLQSTNLAAMSASDQVSAPKAVDGTPGAFGMSGKVSITENPSTFNRNPQSTDYAVDLRATVTFDGGMPTIEVRTYNFG